MVDGVHISELHLFAVDEAIEHRPHSVEYMTGGDVPLKIDHVQSRKHRMKLWDKARCLGASPFLPVEETFLAWIGRTKC